jgi:hypothetical protein
VQVVAPGAEVGKYPFRLYINSVANAEEFDEGRRLSRRCRPPRHRPEAVPWKIVAALVLLPHRQLGVVLLAKRKGSASGERESRFQRAAGRWPAADEPGC